MNEHLWWYSARAAGLVAWTLLAACAAAGIALAFRGRRRPSTLWLGAVHQHLAALAVVFVGVHLGALVADSYVDFGPADLVVPFASAWKPGAVAWGVVAMWLLVAVEVTSLLRRRMPVVLWRRLHLLSHGLFAASTVHLVAAGTDAAGVAVRLLAAVGTLAVLTVALARLAPVSRATAGKATGASVVAGTLHRPGRTGRRADAGRERGGGLALPGEVDGGRAAARDLSRVAGHPRRPGLGAA